jgi:hypothetical protein
MRYIRATIEDIPILTDLRIEFLIEANGQQFENENELRKKIASSLFQKMLEEGYKKNVSKFILNATHDGKGLYEKFGFVLSGDEMHLIVK